MSVSRIGMNGQKFPRWVLAVLVTSALAACGGKDKPAASQVAAKVNSEEISVHQINQALGRADLANVPPEKVAQVRREILDKLIDQQLLVEQAVDKKLDRTPNVMMAIESARREILSRAYVEQLASSQPKPTQEEARKYFVAHPQLFSERKIFNIQEIVIPAGAGVSTQAREMVSAGKSMDEIAAWLKNKGIKFSGRNATQAAEQIALDLLPKLHALKDGQGLVFDGSQNTVIVRVISSQASPVSEAQALPKITQFLGNQGLNEALERELKRIKEKAKLEYVGDFAKDAPVPQAAASDTKAAEKKPVSSIEKGVAGLK